MIDLGSMGRHDARVLAEQLVDRRLMLGARLAEQPLRFREPGRQSPRIGVSGFGHLVQMRARLTQLGVEPPRLFLGRREQLSQAVLLARKRGVAFL
jgi:hypothetical protein